MQLSNLSDEFALAEMEEIRKLKMLKLVLDVLFLHIGNVCSHRGGVNFTFRVLVFCILMTST